MATRTPSVSSAINAVDNNPEIPWTSFEQMNRVLRNPAKRHALLLVTSTRCFKKTRNASAFTKAVFEEQFYNHIWQYT